jgi:hypothetical protein
VAGVDQREEEKAMESDRLSPGRADGEIIELGIIISFNRMSMLTQLQTMLGSIGFVFFQIL